MRLTYPNFARTLQANCITTPDVLSIDIRETDVLDDDVGTTNKPQTLALTKGNIPRSRVNTSFFGCQN
jgi:hypothetical protein